VTPPILPPGSQYQLVFASSPYFAVDTDITAYNTFVSQEASLSSTLPTGITWRAIVSTTSIDAITNAPITAPVYDTRGEKIADDATTFWSPTHLNPILYDQYGNGTGGLCPDGSYTGYDVWTGTNTDGTKSDFPMGGAMVTVGMSGSSLGSWVNDHTAAPTNGAPYPHTAICASLIYALSSPITIVPEPSAFALLGVGIFCLLAYSWRRRK
jgi:hypothetical protein